MNALPSAFVSRILNQRPEDSSALLAAFDTPPQTSIRLNTNKPLTSHDSLPLSTPIPWHEAGYLLHHRPIFGHDPLFYGGAYYVQESSSMALKRFFPLGKTGRVVLDLCAAPGGKSTLLADLLNDEDVLISNEVIRERARVLQENLTRWGYPHTIITHSDPSFFSRMHHSVDVLVVDAPCSGEGMFRKDIAARNQWSLDYVTLCAQRQKRILQNALPCLKPDGTLIYSTCTFAPEENQQVVQWLLETMGLTLYPLADEDRQTLETHGAESATFQGVSGAAYHFWPHRVMGEGLFMVRLRLPLMSQEYDAASSPTPLPAHVTHPKRKRRAKERRAKHPPAPAYDAAAQVAPFLKLQELHPDHLIVYGEQIRYASTRVRALEHSLQQAGVHILQSGLPLGKLSKTGLRPSHALALSPLVATSGIELPREAALSYLKREDITKGTAARGWHLACYAGINLGWLKAGGGQFNNHYPMSWRIRHL